MLLWYDEETNKEYPVYQLKHPGEVASSDFQWIAQTHVDEWGRHIMLWMNRKEKKVYFTICSIM